MLSLILMLFPFLIYYKSFSFRYVLDDSVVITVNLFTKQGIKGIGKKNSTESFTGYFGEQKDLVQGARNRPLPIASFAVEYEIFGENPHLSHFINILLYGILGALTLNSSAVKVNPGSVRANTFMSTALFEKWKSEPESEEKYQWMKYAYYYADQSTKILPKYKNGQVMKAGTAAELYKFDKDLTNLLQVFGEVVIARPDIGYIKDYLEYLEGRVPEDTMIQCYVENIYKKLAIEKKSVDCALVYLNLAQKQFPGNRQILVALANSYQLAGNVPKAQQVMQNLH